MTYVQTVQNDSSATCSCVPNCIYFVLWSGLVRSSVQIYEKSSFSSIFSRLGSFSQAFEKVKEWIMFKLHRMIRVVYAVACRIVFFLWSGLVERKVQSYKKWLFFNTFISLGLFPQVFGQVNGWPILKLHEVIRVVDLVACPIIFILFDDPDWRESVLKHMENDHFLVFIAVWVLFPRFLGRFNSALC